MKFVTSKNAGAMLSGTLLILSSMLVLSNAFAQEKAKTPDGKAIFEHKCLKCHKPEKFNSQHNDRKGWELILSRMERNSCILTDEEQGVLADYLTKVHGED